ncbi:hypothetical protein M407DRAFT_140421 [Tulasnella calospora MUT 4182]|uniref:Protein kinase domain-containing protein n=1 Tax=Tulasnella calospora MUT 4182 TaxID=1051891 RepID=A0A0C3Q7Q5_9AGAM|nr:hypothetical protein M407DRAFT_140421 [Tulasnella calospora MUT 4182]
MERLELRNTSIGRGGFGVVKLAELTLLDPSPTSKITVAIKDLQENRQGVIGRRVAYRLVREMAVWSSFRHENILKFIGYHLTRDVSVAFLVSPYFANGNVRDYLRTTPTTLEKKLELVRDTACGLEYLHTRGPPVVHGDLKALNVLVTDDRNAVLCDFGLTIVLQDGPTGLTTAEGFRGTIRWCSLEVLLGERRSSTSDVWSWGCLVMEIIAGIEPYRGVGNENAIALFMERDRATPGRVDHDSEIKPHRLLRLVRECWDFNVQQRPNASECMSRVNATIRMEQSLKKVTNRLFSSSTRWG